MQIDDNSMEYLSQRLRHQDFFLRRRSQPFLAMLTFLILVGLISTLVVLLPPLHGILRNKELILAAELEGMKRLPALEAKLEEIESKITILSAKSVETRLARIEKAYELGQLKTEDIASISQIEAQMKDLHTYFFSDAKEIADFKELQKNYQTLLQSQDNFATKDTVRSEIGTLQTILTVSLTFFGILFTVVFGSWWFAGRRAQVPTLPIHPPEPGKGGSP
jgi:predicted PurR-regulated permease PerM